MFLMKEPTGDAVPAPKRRRYLPMFVMPGDRHLHVGSV
jgi:hypothetical protein